MVLGPRIRHDNIRDSGDTRSADIAQHHRRPVRCVVRSAGVDAPDVIPVPVKSQDEVAVQDRVLAPGAAGSGWLVNERHNH